MLMFGVLEVALFYQDHEMLSNITREAARRMAIGNTQDAAKTKALQWNMGNSRFTAATVSPFTFEQSTDGSNWGSVSTSTAVKTGSWVRVRTTYRHYDLTRFFGSYYDIHATSIMRVENGS